MLSSLYAANRKYLLGTIFTCSDNNDISIFLAFYLNFTDKGENQILFVLHCAHSISQQCAIIDNMLAYASNLCAYLTKIQRKTERETQVDVSGVISDLRKAGEPRIKDGVAQTGDYPLSCLTNCRSYARQTLYAIFTVYLNRCSCVLRTKRPAFPSSSGNNKF